MKIDCEPKKRERPYQPPMPQPGQPNDHPPHGRQGLHHCGPHGATTGPQEGTIGWPHQPPPHAARLTWVP
jgi:hypothetical protein